MPKSSRPLTAAILRNMKAPVTGRIDVPDGGSPGLALRVPADGNRHWTLRVRGKDGEQRRVTLGEYHATERGLAWAREEAAKVRHQIAREGRDPRQERREAAQRTRAQKASDALTLRVLVEEWRDRHLAVKGRSPHYAAEAVRAVQHAFADHWNAPARNLTRAAVRDALDHLQRPAPATGKGAKRHGGMAGNRAAIAGRTAAYGRACFAWAVKLEKIAANPFANLPMAEPATKRERFLSDKELVAVLHAAEQAKAASYGAIVRVLALTGQRREEVASMTWGQLSPDLRTWTIPAANAKNRRAHIVPLADAAHAIVATAHTEQKAALPAGASLDPEALVFSGTRGTVFSGWSKCKVALDLDAAKHGDVAPWRLHDLRRTFATNLQRLGIRLEVTEAALNHRSGRSAGIVGVYQRHDWLDEKRAAMDALDRHVAAILAGKDKAAAASRNVVALRQA